jgi:hypothetical protein
VRMKGIMKRSSLIENVLYKHDDPLTPVDSGQAKVSSDDFQI